jgi:ABC-type antimicrobial peptide transport system permease subunit
MHTLYLAVHTRLERQYVQAAGGSGAFTALLLTGTVHLDARMHTG